MNSLNIWRKPSSAPRQNTTGRCCTSRRDTVRLPDGKTATREYNIHNGAVCIIPLLENGDVLLERQYRYPLREVITEIPAGKLDAPDEDPLEAAQRELREETGATAAEWHALGLFCPWARIRRSESRCIWRAG